MADDEGNWDLSAIVRSCTSNNSPDGTQTNVANRAPENPWNTGFESNPVDSLASLRFDDEDDPFSFPNLVQPRQTSIHELQDSCRPFLPSSDGNNNILPTTCSIPSFDLGGLISSGTSGIQSHPPPHHQNQEQLVQQKPPPSPSNIATSPDLVNAILEHPPAHVEHQQQQNRRPTTADGGASASDGPSELPVPHMQSQATRSKKKKNHQKVILQVPADKLSNDVWGWRKYGQKSIKGSPHPRNYYRCSSSKGCLARKHVERSSTDPNSFIVSYSGDHAHPRPIHRNSLAGSTRNKFADSSSPSPTEEPSTVPNLEAAATSPASSGSLSPRTSLSGANDNVMNSGMHTAGGNNVEMAGDKDDDDADADFDMDDDDDILNPNMASNEDLIGGFQELGGAGGSAAAGFGGNPDRWC